ncbi:MAG TPA: acyl-CoA carboxylase subunit epsilon [Actinomadura sp.]|jgi:hypothetical protein|nr:acyl-CoA carboxylase subunit epsilon [Actinomadura sp.]
MVNKPFLQVVRGEPTAEEVAALIAVLTIRASRGAGRRGRRGSGWADRSRLMRAPLTPGPGAWRASAFPR